MTDDCYRAFEDRYRGSRDQVTSRLKVYLPFVRPLSKLYTSVSVIDLGCVRGEWLQLLGEEGFDARGVDLDQAMLGLCRERGADAEHGDCVALLRSFSDESFAAVTGFHVAEHMPFEQLRELVAEAHRVLVPGGILILETPNPENLGVSTNSFFLGATHQRPLPPDVLSFVTEYTGFTRTKVIRLNETECSVTSDTVSRAKVPKGVSPNYAVVAQKAASADVLAQFDKPFECEYGVSLEALRASDEERFTAREARFRSLEEALRSMEKELESVYASRSWRATRPLRVVGNVGRAAWHRIGKSAITRFLHAPGVIRILVPLFMRFPGVTQRIRVRLGGIPTLYPTTRGGYKTLPEGEADLTPFARSIYNSLKDPRTKKKGKS